jgi:predicted phosphodiesterase
MQFTFDLISDLHVETWDDFDWSYQATSPYCVVAGDVSKDRKLLAQTLKHLGECYQGVFFIDGNDEHRDSLDNLGQSYKDLRRYVDKFKNVVFMQDNVVVVNGVAFLAVNGWWSFDLDPTINLEETLNWFHTRYGVSEVVGPQVTSMALNDAAYLHHSIKKLQTHQDVKSIVIVSHTVPSASLINHDLELEGHYRFNTSGNPHLAAALAADSEGKIKTWCFGHYHRSVDRVINNVRYVNNCRGRGNTPWSQSAYYPKRITVDY